MSAFSAAASPLSTRLSPSSPSLDVENPTPASEPPVENVKIAVVSIWSMMFTGPRAVPLNHISLKETPPLSTSFSLKPSIVNDKSLIVYPNTERDFAVAVMENIRVFFFTAGAHASDASTFTFSI